jgi:hypothetical protein
MKLVTAGFMVGPAYRNAEVVMAAACSPEFAPLIRATKINAVHDFTVRNDSVRLHCHRVHRYLPLDCDDGLRPSLVGQGGRSGI